MNEARRKQILGCGGWALNFAFSLSLVLIFFADIIRRHRGLAAFYPLMDNAEAVLTWFLIFVIPMTILAIVIGSRSKTRPDLFSISTVFLITLTLTFIFFYAMYCLPIGSLPGKEGEGFVNTPSIGLTALTGSIILGLIVSYGYWHAGRKEVSGGERESSSKKVRRHRDDVSGPK